ncbi:MAG: hypothetical protein NTY64_10175, partial [Deltaproteobacteria bacterium]|nr:hypothetical protein [Deltaproteobacteria bacterium]
TFVAAAYRPSTPHSSVPLRSGIARRVPRTAGEIFAKPSFWRLFTRSSRLDNELVNSLEIPGGHDPTLAFQ